MASQCAGNVLYLNLCGGYISVISSVKIHQTIHLQFVFFPVWMLYLNKKFTTTICMYTSNKFGLTLITLPFNSVIISTEVKSCSL